MFMDCLEESDYDVKKAASFILEHMKYYGITQTNDGAKFSRESIVPALVQMSWLHSKEAMLKALEVTKK